MALTSDEITTGLGEDKDAAHLHHLRVSCSLLLSISPFAKQE